MDIAIWILIFGIIVAAIIATIAVALVAGASELSKWSRE